MAKVTKRKHLNTIRETKKHLLRQTDKCALCGDKILDMKDASVDHILPRSKGGTDALSNLQLAHRSCNFKKGNAV